MEHTFYALFDDAKDVTETIRELDRMGTPGKRCAVIIHRDGLPIEELHHGETFIRRGALIGAAVVGTLAAALGALIMGPPGALFGALAGLAAGAVMGGLAGISNPDRRLEELAADLKRGKVLLTVEAPSLTCEDEAMAAARRHGGRVVPHGMV